jgi:diguanylate cyclase (GGDEF)-like protein
MPLLAAVFGFVQIAIGPETPVVWPMASVAMLVMQMRMLGEKANIDHLTGLYNRKYIDDYVEDLLQSGGGQRGVRSFAALMLDIDGFKKINDSYGHVEGDRAIVAAANLLKKSVRKGDFVARFGGDEFLVILDYSSSGTPKRVIKRVRDNLARFNSSNTRPYTLEFSIGYKLFSGGTDLSAREIFSSIDELMYRNKQSKTTVKIGSGQPG